MIRIILLFVVAAASACSISAAAIVHLKTGNAVQGSIVEKQNDHIIINFYGVNLRYWHNEIDHIEEETPEEPGENVETGETTGIFTKASTRLIAQGDYATAVKILTESVDTGVQTAEIHNNLAIAYALRGDLDSAISSLEKALILERGDAEAEIIRYNLAYLYMLAGRFEDVRRQHDMLKSDNLRIILKRALMTRENGMGANMIIMGSSFPPDTVFFCPQPPRHETNDFLHAQLKNVEKGNDRAYIVENFPLLFFYRSPLASLNYAFGAILRKEFAQAKMALEDSRRASGGSSAYQDTLAQAGAYFAEGQIALEEHNYYLARANFKKAIALCNDWGLFHKYLATTYYLLKRYPQAREEFQTALTLLGNGSLEAREIEEYMRLIPQGK